MIDTVFGIKVRMSGLCINRYRPIIDRLLDADYRSADNRPLRYRCISNYIRFHKCRLKLNATTSLSEAQVLWSTLALCSMLCNGLFCSHLHPRRTLFEAYHISLVITSLQLAGVPISRAAS